MAITLTDTAVRHVSDMLQKRGRGLGLRISTKSSGCSGYAYVVDYADEIAEDDHVFDSSGVKVIVDDKSLDYLNGLELDYVSNNALNQGFEFHNPNVKNICGCGESFSVT